MYNNAGRRLDSPGETRAAVRLLRRPGNIVRHYFVPLVCPHGSCLCLTTSAVARTAIVLVPFVGLLVWAVMSCHARRGFVIDYCCLSHVGCNGPCLPVPPEAM